MVRKLEKLEPTNIFIKYQTCRSCQSFEVVTLGSEAVKMKLCDRCFEQLQKEKITNI